MAFRKVAEFKEITIQYQSNGVSTAQFTTDMPGGALASRLGAGTTIPDSLGKRRTLTIPLDGIEGSEFYPTITPGALTQLRLFSGVVQVRPIGVYIDGSLAEKWETAPLSIGT